MPSLIEIFLTLAFVFGFAGLVMIFGYFLIMSRKHPCEGCDYYLFTTDRCLFNPIYGAPVPKQCQREAWDV